MGPGGRHQERRERAVRPALRLLEKVFEEDEEEVVPDASAAEDLQLDTEPQADASGIEELPVDIEPQAEAEPPKEADVPEAAPVASDESELGILSDDLAMDGSEISLDVDETGDLSLAAEALGQEPSLDALTAEDTQASTEGINVLGETDTEYELADDTSAETKLIPDSSGSLDDGGLSGSLDMALDTGEAARLDEDVNLDSFGSGSGLLDLSLQADDTSLGAVLDDIYPETRAAGETPGDPASGVGLAAEAEKIFEESAEDDPAAVGGAMPAGRIAYAEPVPDTLSHACGYALLIPLAAMIYTVIIALSGTQNLAVTIMKPVQDIIWYIVIGASVAVLAIIGIGAFLGKKPADKTKPKGEVYEKNGKK